MHFHNINKICLVTLWAKLSLDKTTKWWYHQLIDLVAWLLRNILKTEGLQCTAENADCLAWVHLWLISPHSLSWFEKSPVLETFQPVHTPAYPKTRDQKYDVIKSHHQVIALSYCESCCLRQLARKTTSSIPGWSIALGFILRVGDFISWAVK